jgi:hypothetical protein
MEEMKTNLKELAEKSNAVFRERHEGSWCPVWVQPNIVMDEEYGLVDRESILYSSL